MGPMVYDGAHCGTHITGSSGAHLWYPYQRVPCVGSLARGLLRPIKTVGVADPTAERMQSMWRDEVAQFGSRFHSIEMLTTHQMMQPKARVVKHVRQLRASRAVL